MEYNKKEQLLDKVSGLKYINPSVQGSYHNKALDTACVHIKEFFDSEFVPEVPQYIADWFEENKDDFDYEVWKEISNKHLKFDYNEKLCYWIENTEDAIIILVKMYLFGYKVKKDKKYIVKLIASGQYLNTDQSGETYFTAFIQSNYTKEELEEAGFGWVFDCEGMEVEEV